jgi:Tfp pilus assembly protein PilF
MFARRLLAVVLLLLLCQPGFAQFSRVDNYGILRVHIVFPDDRSCQTQLHVVLMGSNSNTPAAETYTNNSCQVDFAGLAVGDYHMVIDGPDVEQTDTGLFSVDARKSSQSLFVTVKRRPEPGAVSGVQSGPPTVAAVDMNIPDNARREYEKAAEPISKGQWKKAKDFILKALAIYPKFAAAYNDLGVVYGRLGDRLHERQSLQQAVTLNDRFAPAYLNLGKMDIADRNFAGAENFLDKAAGSDPKNPATLMLLADVELLNQHYDEAISNCHKVHAMPHGAETLVHYIAARALEHENRLAEAITELRTFLVEEPSGVRADAVRAELGKLQAANNQAANN